VENKLKIPPFTTLLFGEWLNYLLGELFKFEIENPKSKDTTFYHPAGSLVISLLVG